MRERISLLVPFRAHPGSEGEHARRDDWHWLKRYWRQELPDAEIVVGHDYGGVPFSKTNAINAAAQRAHGDVFVILDADCYIPGAVLTQCAKRIRMARDKDVPMWFIPYRHIYRLTQDATDRVLASDPRDPLRFSQPPDLGDVEDTSGSLWGHKFGALIMVMPREAFFTVGCMDKRFRGWGGEDVSFLRALETLYTPHKNTPADVLHLWHPRPGGQDWSKRMWDGQKKPRANEWLASRYNLATAKPVQMRALVDEGCDPNRTALVDWIKERVLDIAAWIRGLWF